MEGLNEAGWYRYPRDFFVGITDRPSKWRMRAYNRTVGISFKPEGMMKIFGFPPKEITNAQISSDAILSKTDLRIPEQLYNIRNIKEQLFLLESFLHNRITHSATRDENFINALSQVRLQSDHFTRQNLFESFFLSERQIQRIFREKIGMSPKAYQKITRFGRLFGALQSGSTPDWTDMAYKMGYSDQAHMIRDFRLYTDSSPSIFDNYPVQITLI